MLHWDVSLFTTFALPHQVQRHHCYIIHESYFNFGSAAICWRLPNRSILFKTTYAHNSIGWLPNSWFKSNFAVLAGGPSRIDTRKINLWIFWGKAKNGSYIKTSAMTESLVKLSQRCIKSDKALEAWERKTTFLTGTATQLVSCWTEFLMQLHANEQNSCSSADIRIHH